MKLTSLTIIIDQNGDGEYMYDILSGVPETEDLENHDGGVCTTTLANALAMATEQAQAIISND